jgi:rSAM/selenodomain-associated transferase 1
MAKVPRAGNVKTRLLPFLTAEQCETLAEAFLADAIFKTRDACDSLIVAFAPACEKNYFDLFDDENLTLIEQRGADLGERMANAFEFAFRLNTDASVVMIGTDSPTFPASFVEQAFEFLETDADAVLGKSDDGGFYLIGLRQKIHPRLFENVEWSSPKVYEQTRQNIERLKINLKLVPAWYDVDAPEDLRRLREEISGDETAQKIAPQTFRWLVEHSGIFGGGSTF